ncbi:MAG: diadenylate cyclase CdaA [Oscillospiraceae bacterium]|nr:diadenylate cyclase CdaA [Oscillospiraceae bacterium]
MFNIGSALEYIMNTVQTIRIIDVIDIIIVSVIIYYAVKFIRDRRAAKLLIGIFFLIVAYVISDVLQMYALNFLLTNVFQVGIIALIVVFQPELRSALEKVGGTSLQSINRIVDQRNIQKTMKLIEIISEVSADFSSIKRGALIVIERTTKLGDIIKSGTVLNSELSVKLLENLFYDKAPLHDGAVIINGNTNIIEAAGCVLPLSSNNMDFLKNVGTRHRAGIGISENSDAVVVIVSEETGKISTAVDGRFERDYDRNSLKKELTDILLEDHSISNNFKNFKNNRKHNKNNKT